MNINSWDILIFGELWVLGALLYASDMLNKDTLSFLKKTIIEMRLLILWPVYLYRDIRKKND